MACGSRVPGHSQRRCRRTWVGAPTRSQRGKKQQYPLNSPLPPTLAISHSAYTGASAKPIPPAATETVTRSTYNWGRLRTFFEFPHFSPSPIPGQPEPAPFSPTSTEHHHDYIIAPPSFLYATYVSQTSLANLKFRPRQQKDKLLHERKTGLRRTTCTSQPYPNTQF